MRATEFACKKKQKKTLTQQLHVSISTGVLITCCLCGLCGSLTNSEFHTSEKMMESVEEEREQDKWDRKT